MRLSLARKLGFAAVIVMVVGGGLLPLAGKWRRSRIEAALGPSYGVTGPGLARERAARPESSPDSTGTKELPPPPPSAPGDAPLPGGEPPWRRTGDECRWLGTRAGVAYPFDVCLAREYRKEQVEIHEGIWGPRIPVPKPASELRIGCFGGSTVEGVVNLPKQLSWPDRLERRLAARHTSGRVRVINFGVAGARSVVARWRFEHETSDLGLDAIVLYVGENDVFQCDLFPDPETAALRDFAFSGDPAGLAAVHPWLSAELPLWRELRAGQLAEQDELVARRRLPPAPRADRRWFSYLTGEVYAERRTAAYSGSYTPLDPQAIRASPLGAVPPDIVERTDLGKSLSAMVEEAQARGMAVVIAIPPVETSCRGFSPFACLALPFRGEDLAAYLTGSIPAWLRILAARYGVPLVDVQGRLASDDRRCDDFVDVVHLSERGMDQVADWIASAVETALAKRAAALGSPAGSR